VLGARGALKALLEGAGFADVAEREIRKTRIAPRDENFWAARLERSFADQLADMTAAERARLDDAVWAAFEPARVDGGWRIDTHVRIGIGTRVR
jgi:hypothetical protein